MKRKISMLLSIVILVTSVVFVNAQETTSKAANRGKLEALNIIEDSLVTASGVTRENFARIMMRFMNMSDEGECTETRFIDVDVNDACAYAINSMYDMRCMIGYENYLFKPKQNITYDEAVCTIVLCLGYNIFGNDNAWPDKRIKFSDDLGLLDDLTYMGSRAITETDIIILLNNALSAEVVGYEGLRGNEPALKYFHEMYETEGVVTANEYTSIVGTYDATPAGYIRVGNVNYTTIENCNDLLGYNVNILWQEINGQETIIYIEKNKKNNVTEISGDDIESVDNNRIEYDAGEGKYKKVEYSDSAKVIYNSGAYTGYGRIEDINFDDTEVKLIDNSRDNIADVIILTKYADYYISNKDENSYAIIDNLNGKRFPASNVDITNSKIRVYNSDEEIIEFKDIPIGAVASIAASQNNEIVRFYISDTKVTGTVKGIDNEDRYTIDNTRYEISSNYDKTKFSVTIGITAEFYIGKTGKIIALIRADGEKSVGVVRKITKITDENDYGKDYVQIKIFTTNGEFVKHDVVKKVKINGTSVKADDNLIDLAGVKINDPIVYTVKDNQLKTIDTMKAIGAGKKGELRLLAQGDQFSASNGIVVGTAAEEEGITKIMSIPSDPSESDDSYAMVAYSGYADQIKNKKFKVIAYGNDDLNIADLILAYDAAKSVIANNLVEMYCVTDICDELVNGDTPATVIRGWEPNSGETKLIVTQALDLTVDTSSTPVANSGISYIKGVDISDLGSGDIIRVAKDSVGEVTKIELVLDYDCVNNSSFDNPKAKLRPAIGLSEYALYYSGKYNEATRIAYSELEATSNVFIQYQTTFYEDNIAWSNNDQTKCSIRSELARSTSDRIVVYNRKTKTCKQIKRTDLPLYIGKKILVHVNQNNMQRLFIYE